MISIEGVVQNGLGDSTESVSTDKRAQMSYDEVVYKGLHKFRLDQIDLGLTTNSLSDEQWGLVALDKCHHISVTTMNREGGNPLSYRVRICKTCCQVSGHIELGTYVDQESAMLVNDVHEIINGRTDRLIILRKEDKDQLHLLTAKRYDRTRGRDSTSILEILAERSQTNSVDGGVGVKKRKSFSHSTLTSLASSISAHSSPGSRNASSSPSTSSSFSEDTTRDDSTSYSVGKQEAVSAVRNLLRESGISAEQSVEGEDFSESMSISNSSCDGDEDNLGPVDSHVGSSSQTEVKMETPPVEDRKTGVFDCLEVLGHAAFSAAPSSPVNARRASLRESSEDVTMANLLLLKSMPDTNLSPLKRQRSSTFSAPSLHHNIGVHKTPMAALTWLAGLEDDEVDVAKSLFELSGALSMPSSANKRSLDDSGVDYAHEIVYGDRSLTHLSDECLEPYAHYDEDLLLPGEELRNRSTNSKSVAVPNNSVSSRASGGVSGSGRARSYSMTYLDRTTLTPSSIASSSSLHRSKVDPLSMALKRFNEKGGHGGEGYIGIYSPEDRKERIKRFIDKRKLRMWTKKVKYDVRKNFADSRVRVKGRFVKKGDDTSNSNSPCSPVNERRQSGGRGKSDMMRVANDEDEEDDDEE